ncbi:MAG: phytanoyl-CoA dioxygenase family protein [Cyclobacteriaceae bacterium]|nr:phytanoyl-CoA dioxygenase family protein [Cyclobacteriaceae bacterium]
MNSPAYDKELKKSGLIFLEDPYGVDIIERWNLLLDPLFNQRDGKRSYVNAKELLDLGILNDIFSPAFRNVLRAIMPDAVLYHCHVYEIDAHQTTSHIHQGSNLGWHRDEECMVKYEPDNYHFLSYFVYLTDVKEESGPFELAPFKPSQAAKRNMPTIKVLGKRGTAFIWNRAYRHRACPNTSDTRRRLLKLSFQHNSLTNDRIHLPEFKEVLNQVNNQDEYLAFLFGAKYPDNGSQHALPEEKPSAIIPMRSLVTNSMMDVTRVGLIKMNYLKPLYNRIKERLGKGAMEPQ